MLHQKQGQYLLGVCLIIITLAITARLLSSPVAAQLGNTGVPVRCIPDTTDGVIAVSGNDPFNCVAADGTAFTSGKNVPSGYYLLVTDIVITPDRLTTVDTAHKLLLRDIAGNNSTTAELRLEVFRSETMSVNHTTPFLVLESGHQLRGEHFSTDSFGINVYVSGLLVTNTTYLPNVIRN